ncbi:hypothetical protein [Collimonas sp.]|jgi:chromosome partitioning protein|uniref:hypothetical protein n=1 Tax=Collimonas sp. TaxID=1963772 RepID=UPI002B721AEB|nr:hypothetical protein [Collimonas sp.]HWX01052.1 hypothetical protein [Collimonas sp.]
MIITIFSEDESAKRSILAVNLATLCALNHRKILLIDATAPRHALRWNMQREVDGAKSKVTVRGADHIQSELADPDSYYRMHYRDIIIDADGADSWSTEAALDAADILLVPVRSGPGDLTNQKNLIQRLETLQLFSPALRMLVVDVLALSALGDSVQREVDAAAALSKKILAATLAKAVIHEWIDDSRTFDQGLSIFEQEPCNERAIAELRDLYQEISTVRNLPMASATKSNAILSAVQRWIHERTGA